MFPLARLSTGYYVIAIMKNWPEPNIHDDETGMGYAMLLRTAWVRREPRKRGGRTIRLDEGTAVALRQKTETWWQVTYHDPLTGTTMDGWIYESLIKRVG